MSRRKEIDREGFLQRIHRRKQAARQGEPLADEPLEEADACDDVVPQASVLRDEDMPPVESLESGSDFSGFLSPGVSDALQRAALRRLWQVADLDFIDDLDIYASDYTEFEPLGDLVTREMRHRLALEARRQAEAAVVEAQPSAEATDMNAPAAETRPADEEQQPADEVSRS
jgi:hypothetical protein